MKRLFLLLMGAILLCSLSWVCAADSGNDLPLFPHGMPNYKKAFYEEKSYDQYPFPTGKKTTVNVEGHFYTLRYYHTSEDTIASKLAIMRNYENAVKAIGGQVLYEAADLCEATMKVVKDGSEYWVHVEMLSNVDYRVFVVVKSGMTQDITVNAETMAQNIKASGKAALYGIYFDTGKAEIKPASATTLQEIAKLLKSDPKLNLYVVGHTDNVGAYDANMKLSKDRADAVVKALTTQYGIAPARLTACGDGPTAPVASNDTEDGRAQNRRVELVKE